MCPVAFLIGAQRIRVALLVTDQAQIGLLIEQQRMTLWFWRSWGFSVASGMYTCAPRSLGAIN